MKRSYYVLGFAIIFIAFWFAIVWVAWLGSMSGTTDLPVIDQILPITIALLWIGGVVGLGYLGVHFIDKARDI